MQKLISLIGDKIKTNKYFVLIIILYFVFRLINLSKPPLFNDESIYLDWGYREINIPGFLFYSLYDAKQPLLMWLFGISQNIFSNPVFAGRLVSVIMGFFTLLGIYKLTNYIFNKKTALLSSIFYISVPLFSFYDRQALMESAIAAVGVWCTYYLVKSLNLLRTRYFVALGIILGLGYFIKSSALIFLLASIILILINAYYSKERQKYMSGLFVLFLCFSSVCFLLFINPDFWSGLSTNSRFGLSSLELLGLPIPIWFSNLFTNLRVGFFLITPLIFLFGIAGIIALFKNKVIKVFPVVFFFLITLLLQIIITRGSNERYVEAFLPLLLVFSAYFLIYLLTLKKTKMLGIILIIISLLFSFSITFLQVYDQVKYFKTYGDVSGVTYYAYLDSFTTGYGLSEVYNYLDNQSNNGPILVGIALNTGNPESALIVNYNKNPNVKVLYIDSKTLPAEINNYDCLRFGPPTYFISRDGQLAGLDKFWIKLKTVKDPYGENLTVIYGLKTDCADKGKFFDIFQN